MSNAYGKINRVRANSRAWDYANGSYTTQPNKTSGSDEPFFNLAAAIIEQAKADLFMAIKTGDKGAIKEAEGFFRSQWGEFLTDCNGDIIIANVEAMAKERKRYPKRRTYGTSGKE